MTDNSEALAKSKEILLDALHESPQAEHLAAPWAEAIDGLSFGDVLELVLSAAQTLALEWQGAWELRHEFPGLEERLLQTKVVAIEQQDLERWEAQLGDPG